MDIIIDDTVSDAIQQVQQLYTMLKNEYYNDFSVDIRKLIIDNKNKWDTIISKLEAKFIFALEWMIGYQFRRDFITDISNTYKNRFTVFGDIYWQKFINNSPVSTEACYYDTLCSIYRSTRINLNINRIQIRTSFTQRPFDCKASGAFLLTDKRECNNSIFITKGRNREIVEFDSLKHCHELIRYYLEHEDEREKIAESGIEKIHRFHTYANRIDEILYICKELWGI